MQIWQFLHLIGITKFFKIMNDNERRQYDAGRSGLEVMAENNSLWNGVTAIVNKVRAVDTSLTKIEGIAFVQQTDTKGSAKGKSEQKRKAANLAWTIAKPLATFARDTNNPELEEKINFSLSELLFVAGTTAKERWQRIHEEATANIAAITAGGYPILQPELDALEILTDGFEDKEGEPRSAKAKTVAATKALKAEFKNVKTLINDLINLVTAFALANTDFYNAVIDGFELVDAGVRHRAARVVCFDDATGVRLPKVKCSVKDTQFVKNGSVRGVINFSDQELEGGNYTFMLEKATYVAETIANIGIEKGKQKLVVVQMKKG